MPKKKRRFRSPAVVAQAAQAAQAVQVAQAAQAVQAGSPAPPVPRSSEVHFEENNGTIYAEAEARLAADEAGELRVGINCCSVCAAPEVAVHACPRCGKSARTERTRMNMRETNEGDLAGDEVPSEEVSGSSVASDQSAHRSE